MLHLMRYLRHRIASFGDQRGVVHMEYVLVGALVAAAAAAVLALLGTGLGDVITQIIAFIQGEVTTATGGGGT